MYWIFLVLFFIAVLIPDIIRTNILFLTETRAEEAAIFLMGIIAFIVFAKNEQLLQRHKKEKEKDEKKIEQTVKDLVESYSYIGEVNRKMDLLMNITLGLSDKSILSKSKENEIYKSIVEAANSLMKGNFAVLRLIDEATGKMKKEIKEDGNEISLKNSEIAAMKEDVKILDDQNCMAICSSQRVNQVKVCLIICGYDHETENDPKNIEIIKVFASQALFLYSYTHSEVARIN